MATIEPNPNRPGGYLLRDSVVVPGSLEEVFAFFSNALNLEEMTPPQMGFKVLTPGPLEMRVGLLIDYKITVMGLPARWRSEITVWEPGVRFVDEQRRGPFRYWEHEHTFEQIEGESGPAVRVGDHIQYAVPGGPLAPLVHRLHVSGLNQRVFAHRRKVLQSRFGG